MKTSRNVSGRPDLIARNGVQDQMNGGELREGKRKRKILGDRTNSSIYDLFQKKKKRKNVSSGEDKENIPPEEDGFATSTALQSVAVRKVEEIQEAETRPLFACDKLRCRTEGHLFAQEYVVPIAMAMVYSEKKSADMLPNPSYFLKQTNIRPRMRTILFSWMTEVHLQFELREVVLWASFQICDRFLSKINVHREKLQLVGCTSMWIASKYHEIYPPLASDLVHLSDRAFTKDEIILMECQICDTLSYKFSIPNAFQFLDRFTEVAVYSIKEHRLKNRVKWLARYGMERFHMQVKALQYCPSLLAAGALFTALKLTSHRWTRACECVSGYSESRLFPKFPKIGEQSLFEQIKKAVMDFESPSHQAIIFKYKKAKRGSVSTLRKKEKSIPRNRAS